MGRKRKLRNKDKPRDQLKLAIINASRAIRKKQLQLKLGRSAEDELLNRSYKPITDPIKELTATVKSETKAIKAPLEELGQTVKKESKSIKEPLLDISNIVKQPKPEVRKFSTFIADDDVFSAENRDAKQESEDEASMNAFREYYKTMSEERPQMVEEFLGKLNPLPKTYLDGFFKDTKKDYDTTYGIRYNRDTGRVRMGKSDIGFDGNDIIIDRDKRFKGTPGLYELIYKNQPKRYNENDASQYYDILQLTNVHRREFDGAHQLRGSTSYKWMEVIKPILSRKRQLQSWTGGSGMQLIANTKTPYQYVYWDDVNEIIDRLRLLMASKAAGHTSHENEIVSIIEELKEIGLIE